MNFSKLIDIFKVGSSDVFTVVLYAFCNCNARSCCHKWKFRLDSRSSLLSSREKKKKRLLALFTFPAASHPLSSTRPRRSGGEGGADLTLV